MFVLPNISDCNGDVVHFAVLTQQYDGTQENGNEGPSAETRSAAQSLCITQFHIALTVAGAHPHSQGAGAALHGVVAISDHHGNQVHALVKAAVAGSACQDAGSVICGGQSSVRTSPLQCTVWRTL